LLPPGERASYWERCSNRTGQDIDFKEVRGTTGWMAELVCDQRHGGGTLPRGQLERPTELSNSGLCISALRVYSESLMSVWVRDVGTRMGGCELRRDVPRDNIAILNSEFQRTMEGVSKI